MTDLILENDAVLIVDGNLGIGTKTPTAPLHVDGNSAILTSGGGAGYAFLDRTQGERWVWYAQDGTARLYTDSQKDLLSIGPSSELLSMGSTAGYAFMDRTQGSHRWVWYAQDNSARLYTDNYGDLLTASSEGDGWITFNCQSVSLGQLGTDGNNYEKEVFKWPSNTNTLAFAGDFDQVTIDTNITEINGKLVVQKDLTVQGKFIGSLTQNTMKRPLAADEARNIIESLRPVAETFSNAQGASFEPSHLPELLVTSKPDGGLDILALLSALVRVVQAQGEEIAALKGSGK